jgi:hypothetical protein
VVVVKRQGETPVLITRDGRLGVSSVRLVVSVSLATLGTPASAIALIATW